VAVAGNENFRQRIYRFFEYYHAGITIAIVAVPSIMIAVTLIFYMCYMYENLSSTYPSGSILSVVIGVFGGLVGWIIVALGAQTFAAIDRAYPTVYHELRSRFEALQPYIDAAMKYSSESTDKEDDGSKNLHRQRQSAIAEMTQHCSHLREVLGDKEPPKRVPEVRDWIQAYGYVKLFERLHRLNELLILFHPVEILNSDAWEVRLRLRGSPIDNRDLINNRLQVAERALAQRYNLHHETSTSSSHPSMDDFTARETMLKTMRLLNEFRDELRMGLVRARNQVLKTVTLTSFVVFTLLVCAVLASVPTRYLVGGTTFFIVGAVMGLFSRLRQSTSSKISTEDFGLATARLLHIPLISGLAALGGVVIIPFLVSIASHQGTSATTQLPSIKEIFDISQKPFNLVLAAIFGLSPTALINRLQQEAEQYKTDLKSTGPTTRRGEG
jgi:hypothetical protein